MRQTPPVYVVDTCSFTELKRRYPREVLDFPWRLVEALIESHRLWSVEDVWLELQAQDDEVASWARERRDIFLPLSPEIQLHAREVLRQFPTLVDLKRKKSSADAFVVACALHLNGATVVTQENRSGGPPAVKIPDVCQSLDLRCVPLLTLVLEEKAVV